MQAIKAAKKRAKAAKQMPEPAAPDTAAAEEEQIRNNAKALAEESEATEEDRRCSHEFQDVWDATTVMQIIEGELSP